MSEDVRLYQGNCLVEMSRVADGSAHLIACDLPYGSTQCRWDTVIPFAPLWSHYRRIIKPRGAIVLTASQPFTSALVMSNPGWFRHEWVWIKNLGSNFANTVREPFKEHEAALVFSQGGWTFNKMMQVRSSAGVARAKYADEYSTATKCYGKFGGSRKNGRAPTRVPSSYQKFNCDRGLHPTQKPVALMEYLIRTYTNEGETVMDNCFGSGTTGVACVNTGRNFIGIERDPEYFRIGSERIAAAQRARSELLIPA